MKHNQEKTLNTCCVNADTKLAKTKKQDYAIYDEEGLRKRTKIGARSVHEDTETDCVEYLQCVVDKRVEAALAEASTMTGPTSRTTSAQLN